MTSRPRAPCRPTVIQKALGRGLHGGFWPVVDGDVLPGDQYMLYSAGRFNDTNVLIGTNSDEGGACSSRRRVTRAQHSKSRCARATAHAPTSFSPPIPHATTPRPRRRAGESVRDSTFAWHTWAWASCNPEGQGQGLSVLLRSPHAAYPKARAMVLRSAMCFATWAARSRAGGPPGTAHRRGCRNLRSAQRLLGELRKDRQSQWSRDCRSGPHFHSPTRRCCGPISIPVRARYPT